MQLEEQKLVRHAVVSLAVRVNISSSVWLFGVPTSAS
jgi:hypothetical protein